MTLIGKPMKKFKTEIRFAIQVVLLTAFALLAAYFAAL